MVHFANEWDDLLADEFQQDYYLNLREFLKVEYRTRTIYPDMYEIFTALKLASFSDVKVVVLGQDPYHGPGQAHGLSFSVQAGTPPPPSLVNIFKELKQDVGAEPPGHGHLLGWAEQGVLLLNSVLTVEQERPGSHAGKG